MRWVLMTAFGEPVEPEVNRNFAGLSGSILLWAASTSDLGGVAANSEKRVAWREAGAALVTTNSISCAIPTSMARRYFSPFETKTSPGVSRLKQWRSWAKSFETSE
jgi:hypothetical protein